MSTSPSASTRPATPRAFGPSFWHPFSSVSDTRRGELIIEEGRGSRVRDAAGRWYLDATASLWYANVGHGERRIAEAIGDQAGRLAAYSNFGDFATAPTVELTAAIAQRAPLPDPMVFLTSGGSDAVDSAAKIVRRFWTLQGRPERQVLISRTNAYHGMHGHGTSLAGIEANLAGYGDRTGGRYVNVAHDDAEALAEAIGVIGANRVGAFFVEPIIGAGGVIAPAPGYLQRVQEICREHDVLLIADEVITGFGRTGDWFASTSFGITPDLLLFAKGVTSGYVPLGGVVVADRIWGAFAGHGEVFRHGYTYSGHAVAAAAALANLQVLEDDDLLGRVRSSTEPLHAAVGALADLPQVREVRADGFLAAVAFDHAALPGLAGRVLLRARANGLLTRVIAGDSLQISPPFVITPDEIDDLRQRLTESIREAVEES